MVSVHNFILAQCIELSYNKMIINVSSPAQYSSNDCIEQDHLERVNMLKTKKTMSLPSSICQQAIAWSVLTQISVAICTRPQWVNDCDVMHT